MTIELFRPEIYANVEKNSNEKEFRADNFSYSATPMATDQYQY